ncbi:MAG: class I SAM-dependent methyltransferase [Candidatus Magasanikiibacteriota bacterium]
MLQYYRMQDKKTTMGWGKTQADGVEIWDTNPVFLGEQIELKDWAKLLFYPKKWFLYRYIKKHINQRLADNPQTHEIGWQVETVRILDVGCGTGASLVDLKKMFGRQVEVCGVDVIKLQIDLAKEKVKQNGVHAEVEWYDGEHLPFENNYFDAIYTSDVLGHVANVPAWLKELNRVLKFGGVLAMFSESKLGRHAYVRNYLMKRGLNIDPHAEFHISLYSKSELKSLLANANFDIEKMYTAFWASFLVHPDEFFWNPERARQGDEGSLFNASKNVVINSNNQLIGKGSLTPSSGFGIKLLKFINKFLYWLKKKLHPYSTALCELYGLVEMYAVGKYLEAQGYVILGKKIEK